MRLQRGVVRFVVPLSLVGVLVASLAPRALADTVLTVRPRAGPAGSVVRVRGTLGEGTGATPCTLAPYSLGFEDSAGTVTNWGTVLFQNGSFKIQETIPAQASLGIGHVRLYFNYRKPRNFGCGIEKVARRWFTVTPG